MDIKFDDVILALKHLFPALPDNAYVVVQRGKDTQIEVWNPALGPKPTDLEIAQALPIAKVNQAKIDTSLATINQVEDLSGFSRKQREFLLSFTAYASLKTALENHEAQIQAQRDILAVTKP